MGTAVARHALHGQREQRTCRPGGADRSASRRVRPAAATRRPRAVRRPGCHHGAADIGRPRPPWSSHGHRGHRRARPAARRHRCRARHHGLGPAPRTRSHDRPHRSRPPPGAPAPAGRERRGTAEPLTATATGVAVRILALTARIWHHRHTVPVMTYVNELRYSHRRMRIARARAILIRRCEYLSSLTYVITGTVCRWCQILAVRARMRTATPVAVAVSGSAVPRRSRPAGAGAPGGGRDR